jgi:hypothetical protein
MKTASPMGKKLSQYELGGGQSSVSRQDDEIELTLVRPPRHHTMRLDFLAPHFQAKLAFSSQAPEKWCRYLQTRRSFAAARLAGRISRRPPLRARARAQLLLSVRPGDGRCQPDGEELDLVAVSLTAARLVRSVGDASMRVEILAPLSQKIFDFSSQAPKRWCRRLAAKMPIFMEAWCRKLPTHRIAPRSILARRT